MRLVYHYLMCTGGNAVVAIGVIFFQATARVLCVIRLNKRARTCASAKGFRFKDYFTNDVTSKDGNDRAHDFKGFYFYYLRVHEDRLNAGVCSATQVSSMDSGVRITNDWRVDNF